jgi:hypothetical protein
MCLYCEKACRACGWYQEAQEEGEEEREEEAEEKLDAV